ncbi:hypothetical protein MASR2M17_01110 [Aminivibrio sp.]
MGSMRRFVGIDLGNEPVPDETAICKFRHLLEVHGLRGTDLSGSQRPPRGERTETSSEGTIMDATIINAPSSTKNQDKKRILDMHSTKKETSTISMKIHVGVDREKNCRQPRHHPANVHDLKDGRKTSFTEENAVFGDSAYMGKMEEIAKKAPQALDLTPDA